VNVMNENRKRELERFFDGELPPGELDRVERELVVDVEGARYIDQLRRLRQLAVGDVAAPSHVCSRPVVVSFPRHESWRNRLIAGASAVAAAAAGIVALVWWWDHQAGSTPQFTPAKPAVVSKDPQRPKAVDTDAVPPSPAASLALDAQRHVWANGELPSPAVAARLVLDHAAEPARPTPAEAEIFALELANSTAVSAQDVARAVTERTSGTRHPPARNRTNRRPAGSPPSTQRDQPDGVSIAELSKFLLQYVG